ncbi:hypothetical protein BDP27DRAFT_840551 [Rhodocollybia butyracea]|uniref:FHA domain-containing protein n=1 Tax=Rhodocollybia butyracea TaxID=206335 RepID=A0A9P5U6V7_9AGAR|nr:hypothetical protein BDP27DRAFT_840551 [Rhodocollybia butyracea]
MQMGGKTGGFRKESRFIRSKILGSFLGRERPVNSPTYDPVVDSLGQGIPQGRSLGGATSDVSSIEPDTTSPNNTTRRYVAAAVSTPHKPVLQHADSPQSASSPFYPVRLVPHLGSRSPFYFKAITRNMRVGGPVLRIGRFTDNGGYDNDDPHLFKLGFKSKVMSRAHAELWLEARSGSDASLVPGVPKLFIRDTRSSSGTFLNDTRLATAGDESRPFELKDGDLLQMGVDFQGGIENAHKSVKIRIELDCEWQTAPAIDEQISDIELLDTTLPPAPGVDLSLPASPVVDLTVTHSSGNEQPQLQDPITPVIHEEKSNTGLGFQVDDVRR